MHVRCAVTARRAAVVAIVLAGALWLTIALLEVISPFRPHAFYGVSVSGRGEIRRVFPSELPPGTNIVRGQHIVERAGGSALRGFELRIPHAGDSVHVITPGGIVTVTAEPQYYVRTEAIAQALRELTCAIVILLATLMFVRRPGWMAFAFWVWAISGVGGGDVDYALDIFPRNVGLAADIFTFAFLYSGFALISFALRFPDGNVSPRWRLVDIAAWLAFAASVVFSIVNTLRYFQGLDGQAGLDLQRAALSMLPAAAIFVWKQARALPLERPKLAWATTAFVGSAVMRAAAYLLSFEAATNWRIAEVFANLLPLLAIYPVLRHRLFDLGFVVNRAAVYSFLTLAAFGTLAAANWIAQHFVTDRLAFVMQPIAAIAIGLGYFRVRTWAQHAIERVLFRERFAAEAHLEAVIRGLPFVERASSVDDVLVAETARTLRIASAALFHVRDGAFARTAAIGWDDVSRFGFASDDLLARHILADGPLVTLSVAESAANGFPPAPRDPVVALGIVRRGVLGAIVLYGRHENGTELEPAEIGLLKRLGSAAAIAYEAADIMAVRERNRELEDRVRQLELGAARI